MENITAAQRSSLAVEEYQLDLLRTALATRSYAGYPLQHDRFVMHPALLDKTDDDRLVLPDGPWAVDIHPNRPDTEAAPSSDKQQELTRQGYDLDSCGRPLHPWLYRMLADPDVGVVTGKGFFWSWGPNRVADPIVVQNDRVLVIRRRDTGEWALPGGFIDKRDGDADTAARRETAEETGIHIPSHALPKLVYCGVISDLRTTANAWPETTALLYEVDSVIELGEPRAGDDAEAARWLPLKTALADEQLGVHRYLITLALGRLAMNSAR